MVKGKSPFLFIGIAVILVLTAVWALWFLASTINLGLDLDGGVYVLLEATETENERVDADTIQRAITVIRNRVDELGVTEPVLQKEGDRRIRVELPGIKDQARALEVIGRTAQLTFVDPEGEVILTGANLKDAYLTWGPYNEPMVALEFDAEGTARFAEATRNFLGEVIAIYLDDELVSSPTVKDVVTEGEAVITGIPTAEEAGNIALMLRSGALPVELEVLETRSVGPILGENSLRVSLIAGSIGLAGILLFLLIYYRFAGLVANITLVVYISLVLTILSLIKATLTLPGIAGLILSMGMAVDANVIIFERIKEELAAGRSIRSAVEAGFDRAFRAIFDANVTTIIAALILFFITSGPIRGFGFILFLGIILSMFSAIILNRYLLRLAVEGKLMKTVASIGRAEKVLKEA